MSRRGWAVVRAVALTLVVALFAPVSPVVLVCVPLAVQLLAFRRTDAISLALAAVLLLVVFQPGGGTGPLWFAERAWGLLLGGGFVAVTVLWSHASLLLRSLAALAAGIVAVVATGLVRPDLAAELDWWIVQELQRAAGLAYEWMASGAGIGGLGPGFERRVLAVADWQSVLYPSFLALASLASLAVGWFVVRRLSGREEVLGPVREFRFSGGLVWLLVAGCVLFLLPAGETVRRVGENAMVFMGGLYLLRGVGVLLWVGASVLTTTWSAALWSVVALLLYPVVLTVALLLGIGDTWIDVRTRLTALMGRER